MAGGGWRRPGTRRRWFNLYVLLGSLAIFLAVGAASFRVADRVERQANVATWLLSHFASLHLSEGDLGEGLRRVLQISRRLEVPLIVTDNQGRPLLWNGPVVGIPMPDDPEDLARRDDPETARRLARIAALVRRFDAQHEPYAITDPATGQRVMTLHYGPSPLGRRIRWLPYLELLLLAVFFLLILWALRVKWEGDEQRLFAGMAKETAHQLGTPITSIMGWLAVLRERLPAGDTVLPELEQDVARLAKVSARFSQIGSRPQRDDTDLAGVVEATVAYFRRRLPHLNAAVTLNAEGRVTHRCRFNRDLLEWVLENLIKNGIDALGGGDGAVTVALADGPGGSVQIRVRDTGRGIPPEHRNRIFEAGFTTKSRGWGMGLSLVRRIVVRYHGGRVEVERSGPGGTTFLITLPGEETTGGIPDPVGG